ncbi:MAG: histidine kinase [Saprospiraceae bacterium]|nr:histidine kinase [Saprospiraceae bacterium]
MIRPYSKITFCLIFLSNWVISTSRAQNRITNLQHHLKNYSINRILPDDKGFLWVCTDKGLVRYDGSRVKNYLHDPENPRSLAGNYVNDIIRDKEGRLWIATGNAGLSCFDPRLPENQAFTNYRADINNPEALISNELYCLTMDETGAIWLGGNEGHLVRFDPQTGKAKRFDSPSTSPNSTFYALHYLGNGQLYVGTNTRGLALFDTKLEKVTKRWDFKDRFPADFTVPVNSVCDFAFDAKRHVLWIASLSIGLTGLDLTNGTLLPHFNFNQPTFQFSNWQNANAVHVAEDGNIWVAYRKGGVFVYNPDTKKTLQDVAFESPTVQKVLPFDFKKVQFDAKTGLTWLVTTKGLFSYNPNTHPLSQFTPLSMPMPNLPKTHTETADGLLWLLQEKTLVALDPRSGQRKKSFPLPSTMTDIMGIECYDSYVFFRGANSFWVCDKNKGSFKKLLADIDASDLVQETSPNGSTVVWLSTYGKGLFKFSQNFSKIDSFFPNLKIIGIEKDAFGHIWLCTDGQGAWRITDKEKGLYQVFQNDPSPKESSQTVSKGSLPENVMIHAYSDKKGRLWLGSMSNGLVGVGNPNSDKPQFHAYPLTPIGSPSIMDFREDADGMLWLWGSDEKWYLFNPETHECLQLNPGEDILPDIELYKMALVQGQNGIWALTPTGIRLLDATSAIFRKKKLHVQFLDFKIFERPANERLLQTTIHLSPKENYFTLTFGAPDFESPTRIRYFYKLDGFDAEWVNAGTKTEVHYNNLDGGTYTFKVRAVYGNDDPQNAEESTLTIVVEPPFWKAWWFRTLVLLALAGIIYTFFRLKINAVRHEAELKTEFNNRLAEVRISALRAQMNPHFIFNCLNTIEGFVLENKKWEASVFLQKFSKLIRLVLENAQYNTVPLEQDLTALKMYIDLEKVRYEGKFEAKIEADETLLEQQIPPMILQPYVENAILHGLRHLDTEGGHLVVKIMKKGDNHLEYVIEDNGIGRKNAQSLRKHTENLHKTSLGLKVTAERLHIFSPQAVLTTEDVSPDKKNTGTRVRILMPIQS